MKFFIYLRKLHWVFFLICISATLSARTPVDVDSLTSLLSNAKQMIPQNLQKADSLSEIVLEKSLVKQNDSLTGRAYYLLGVINYYKGNHLLSSGYYNKGLETEFAGTDEEFASALWNNLGVNLEYEKAEEAYLKSLQLAETDSAISLLHSLKVAPSGSSSPEEKIFIHQHLAKCFINKNKSDSAMKNIKNALQLSGELKDKTLYFNNLALQAEIFELKQQKDTAIILYKTAIKYFEKNKENVAAGKAYLKLGQLYMFTDDNEAALKTLFKAEEKLDDSGEFKTLGQLYENIAEINISLGHEDKVIHYMKKAIECFKKLDDLSYLAEAYAQIGVSYKVQEKYDTALFYYNKSVEIAKNRNAHQLLAQNYMNMANAYDLTGNRETAMEYHHKSIEICREHDIPYGLYLNYINLAEINLQEENFEEATVFLNDALELGNEKGYEQRIPLFENLFYAAKKTGRYKKAVEHLEKAYELKDSLYEAQKHQEVMELQTRYETKEKEAEILRLNNKDQHNALVRAYLIIVFVSVLVVGIAILFFLRRKMYRARQRTLKLENENERKKEHIEKVNLEKKLHQKEAEKYRLDLEMKEQELVFQTLREAGIKQINQSVKKNLAPFAYKMTRKKDKEEFSDRLDQIAREALRDPLCEFEQMFLQMHDGFYEKLLGKAPDLSNSELQMCALLRMNLPSKEIATLLNLALSTVDQRRYNIRKKMNLDNQENLVSFLISL